jgi:hypothetical protein
MIVPAGHHGRYNNDSSYSTNYMPSQSWYNQSIWQSQGGGQGRNTNAWGVSKPNREKSQYQFNYQADGQHVGGQINCGNQFCCGASVTSDGANCWPVPVASDMPNAFNMINQMCHSYFDYFEQTQDQMHKHCSRLAQQLAQTQDSLATLAKDVQSRPQFRSGRGWNDTKYGDMNSSMYGQFGQKDFGNYGRSQGFGGNNSGNFNKHFEHDMMRQMEDRVREMEYAFKHMDQCMEEMNSDYRSAWKESKGFHSYNDWDRRSNEADFRTTLKNGEFFEKWHYQDQRVWKLEHYFMEMAKRMNFMELETQMQAAMNNHNSMYTGNASWMNNNQKAMGNDFNTFSKMGHYGNGNNHGSGNYNNYNMSSDMNNMSMSIAPPSGGRRNPSRPAFANLYNNNNRSGNYSSGMHGSKFGAMYDDGFSGMSNRFDNYSGGDRFGNQYGGMYGSKFGSMYDDGMNGPKCGGMGNQYGSMYGSKFNAMYDDGMCGSKCSGMGNMYGSKFSAMYDDGMCGSKYGVMSNGGMSNMYSSNMGFSSPCRGRII